MKRKLLFLSAIALLALNFTACVSTNKGFQSSPVISRNVNLDPIKADIKVDEERRLRRFGTP
jgi:hypothetical protein